MRITILGDILVQKKQLEDYATDKGYNFGEALSCLRSSICKSDYVIGNLETPLAGEELGYTNEAYSFNTPNSFAEALRNAGIDMVQTSNNHCLDRGVEGLRNTIDNLEKNEIAHIGTRKSEGDSYTIVDIQGMRIGFLGFTYGTNAFVNNEYLTEQQMYMVDLLQPQELSNDKEREFIYSKNIFLRAIKLFFYIFNIHQFRVPVYNRVQPARKQQEHLVKTIKKCRADGADYIVAFMHIGSQYGDEPTEYTKQVCNLCKENGVNLVMANHEHVIHNIDIKNVTSRYFCEYSQGNFLSVSGVQEAPFDKKCEYSVVYHIDVQKSESEVEAEYYAELFVNHLKEGYGVVTESVVDYMKKVTAEERGKLERDYQYFYNKIMCTEGVHYQLLREQKIPRRK